MIMVYKLVNQLTAARAIIRWENRVNRSGVNQSWRKILRIAPILHNLLAKGKAVCVTLIAQYTTLKS
jgi:hypothetical protein